MHSSVHYLTEHRWRSWSFGHRNIIYFSIIPYIHLVYLLLLSKQWTDGRWTTDGHSVFTVYRSGPERSGVVCSECTAVQRTPVSSDPLLTGATSEPWSWLRTQCVTDKRHVWHVWWARADMTVLTEDTSPVIMTSGLGGDRYITPEYLAPLPQVYFFIFIIWMGFRADHPEIILSEFYAQKT